MATGWTSERRALQGKLIRQWLPWEKSTGPRTSAGKDVVSRNASKGGTWRLLRELSSALRERNKRLLGWPSRVRSGSPDLRCRGTYAARYVAGLRDADRFRD